MQVMVLMNLDINSATNSGYISLGSSPNTSIAGTGKGVYMDGTGDFLLYGSATNYFKFDAAATAIDIKSDTFDLDATTLILDSGTNSGKIALGRTPPTSITTNAGFYADGTGKLLIGSGSGARIQFDGTDLIMSSSKFFLGDATNFVSGSNGNIRLS